MSKEVLVVLAEGFEEIEAAAPIDILRRAGLDVVVAGLTSEVVTGAHGVQIKPEIGLTSYESVPDAIVLPGGSPGAENLASSMKVKDLVQKVNAAGNIVAAICASPPLVLAPTGILEGKKATCYPGMEKSFLAAVNFVAEDVIQDGNVITSRGPATALAFGLKIVEALLGKPQADAIAAQVLVAV